MNDFKIIKKIATIGEKPGGWHLELNIVKWNQHPEKLDLRSWNQDHTRCGKGITLTEAEAAALCAALEAIV